MWDKFLMNPWDQQHPCPAGFYTMLLDIVVVGLLAGTPYTANPAVNSAFTMPKLSLTALASATTAANADGVARKESL